MALGVELGIIAMLFGLGLAVTYERPRAWLIAGAQGLAARYGRPEHDADWEQEHAELWLMARRKQLVEDLRRIEHLIRHDEHMSATRQIGNRLARDQLIASLARIPDVLPGRDRSLVDEWTAPSPAAPYDLVVSASASSGRAPPWRCWT